MTFLVPQPASPPSLADADAAAAGASPSRWPRPPTGALVARRHLPRRPPRALRRPRRARAGHRAASWPGETATDARYVREWLEQQAAAGVLTCEDPTAAPDARRFALPAGHADALINPDSLATVPGMTRLALGSLAILPRLLEAFGTGAGIPYADYGADVREGIADGNRPLFTQLRARSGCRRSPRCTRG